MGPIMVGDLPFQCNHCSGRNSHDSDCTQRLVPCPVPWQCYESFKFANFLRDFESSHGKLPVMENGASVTTGGLLAKSGLNDYFTFGVKIEAYGRVFISSSFTMDGVYYEWVKLLGTPSEAKDFIFSLEYKGSGSTHVYLGKVASIDETLTEVLLDAKCSSIGFEVFKRQFMEGNTSNYHWSITIKRLDE